MTQVKIYGIKNCNTMKKTFDWLDEHDIAYDFHDYKKLGADKDLLEKAFAKHGWEKVINRAGMTWRKLPDDVKEKMTEKSAMTIALENPSIIKRPIATVKNNIHLGFSKETYLKLFS